MIRSTVLLCIVASTVFAADYKAGVGRVVITPGKPIYLSGYASRNHPSEGKIHDLWAKALAIEDSRGGRVVIVTTDVVGLPRSIADAVAVRAAKEHGVERAGLVLTSSHTHTGPLIRGNLESMFQLSEADRQVVQEYGAKLTDDLVMVIGQALQKMTPVNLSYAKGSAGFAINRREPTPKGVKIGVNPGGPVDHDVPVLTVSAPDGKKMAILFGYACHNTTLTGQFYQLSGDYAGFAQYGIEEANPGTTALYVMLCGADQNPEPRSSLDLARQHGKSLADEVNRVLGLEQKRVSGRIRTAFQLTDLSFAAHNREMFEQQAKDSNQYRARNAERMLKLYDEGRPLRKYPYPVQAAQFGNNLTLVALGGEVVVDYVLRLKREYGSEGLFAVAYANDVMSYIPSLRVLKEGGYEAVDSMYYYGMPGPWNEDVEENIFGTLHKVLDRVGRKPAK
jgi:hypothetical protein